MCVLCWLQAGAAKWWGSGRGQPTGDSFFPSFSSSQRQEGECNQLGADLFTMSTYERLTTDLLPHLWQAAYVLASKRCYLKDTLQYPESCWKPESARKPAAAKGLAQGRHLLTYGLRGTRSVPEHRGADRQQHLTTSGWEIRDPGPRLR